MNRAFLVILFLHFGMLIYAQKITGLVLNQDTREAVDFASVFFNGTFVGTSTNDSGYFELDVSKYRTRPLTISAVGYHSDIITDLIPGNTYEVSLKARVFEIEEVSVTSRSLVRKRKACMRIFKKEFIGLTSNARRCYILNEEDISFNYGSDKDTLRAFASKPILIQNLSLGYDISYHLDRFEYDRITKTVLYTGNIIFNRDLIEDEESMKKYERRRAYAYTGSSKHFFRALWANSLKASGFSVSSYRTGEALNYELIVFQDFTGSKSLQYNEDLQIRYYDHLSYISFREYKVIFEQDGFFDPTPIIWTGIMSEQRIADFLPYEYLVSDGGIF
jgi:hypothetical protein